MAEMNAREIIDLLEAPIDDRRPIKWQVSAEAPVSEITLAIEKASPLTRQILCDILGERCELDAVPALLRCLYDPAFGVRNSAADALGKIGDSQAGPALLDRFVSEDD